MSYDDVAVGHDQWVGPAELKLDRPVWQEVPCLLYVRARH